MELNNELKNLLLTGDYKNALQSFASVELEIEDGVEITDEQFVQFYSTYLILFLINGDLNGAKYLWKRSPDILKNVETNSKFVDIWSVSKFLWRDEYPTALKTLRDINWPVYIANLVEVLKNSLVEKQLQMLSSAYSVVKTSQIADAFSTTKEEAIQFVQNLGWRVENELVYPTVIDQRDTQRRVAVEKLAENLHVMERITTYAAQFDKASLKVDLSGKDSSSGTNTTSGKASKAR